MRKELVDIVCCPDCRSRLALQDAKEDEHGEVVKGGLYCKKCDFRFPIEEGIPNLLPKDYHVA